MPKVSIIIPVYNTEKYLSQCLESLQNQTLTNFEVVCINDESVDSSLKILKDFVSKDQRFIIIDKENEGQGIARNLGILKAKGEYILFLDSDDWLEPAALEKAYNKIKTDEADVLIFNTYNFFEETQTKSLFHNTSVYSKFKSCPFAPKEAGKTILLNNSLAFKIYKREFLVKNNITYSNHKFMEDAPFYIKTMLCAQKVTCLDEPILNYRVHKQSYTFKNENYLKCIPEVYDICFDLIKNYEKDEVILSSFLENRKRALLSFYDITSFSYKHKYYKMMKKIIEKHFLKYDFDNELKEVYNTNFLLYELKQRLGKTKIILETYRKLL